MKVARKNKSLTYKGRQVRFAADLSTEVDRPERSGGIYSVC